MSNVMEEVHLTAIKPKNNVLLLAQEISFAKVLACNDKRLRDRGLRRLKKWFMSRSQGSIDFTRDDHMRIWKGLFYCMWMSDKPLIQEELAEDISNLVHSFASFKSALLFVETFFTSLSIEWFGIDQLRLDKFMMLVRRFLRKSLELVARIGWPEDQVQALADVFQEALSTGPMGLSMHVIEIFCEELAKVGKGELSSDTILQFVSLFAHVLASLKDGRLISQITCCVFLHLMRQTELGIEHQMKFSAWKEHGFPGGHLSTVEKAELESDSEEKEEEEDSDEGEEWLEEEEREVGVDARAGRVDVLLPPLDFDPRNLLKVLRELRSKKETTTKARKTLIQLIKKFENLAEGKYPLGLQKVELPEKINKKKEIVKAAKKLLVEEQQLMQNGSDEEVDDKMPLKRKGKKNKPVKKKISAWKVSDSTENSKHNLPEKGKYWEISQTTSKDNLKSSNKKKRKLSDDEILTLEISNLPKFKKARTTSFSVSNSKENNCLSPGTSKLKGGKPRNTLENSTSNNQVSKGVDTILTEVKSRNKNRKNKRKVKPNNNQAGTKSQIVEDTTKSSAASTGRKENKNNSDDNPLDLEMNVSSTDKNSGWGGEWDEPLQEGEYEMFIPSKKYVEKRKSLGLSYPVSSFVQKSVEKITPINGSKIKNLNTLTPNSQKKVEFNLSANSSQDYKEYSRKVKKSKSQVPFDATKKPVQGLLKNSTPSPINPFYRKKLNFLKTPNKS